MSTYKGENQLKIWVLKPDSFPETKEFSSYDILISAIKDLQDQARVWTRRNNYLPKIKLEVLRDQSDPASVHARRVKDIKDSVSDLKEILQEKNRSNEFNQRIADLDQTESALKQFYEQIQRIEQFVGKLQEWEVGARSLMIALEDDTAGLDSLNNQWADIILMNLSDDLKDHPAVEWVKNMFKKTRKFRTDVQRKLDFVKLAYQFDKQFGWGDIEVERSTKPESSPIRSDALQAYLKYAEEKELPLGTWIDWAYSQLKELKKLDPDNHANWKDLIKFGDLSGKEKVKNYLDAEKKRIRVLHRVIEETSKLPIPAIHSRYGEMLRNANYLGAYYQVCDWIRYPAQILQENQDNSVKNRILHREVGALARVFRKLDDVESLETFLNSPETENIPSNNTSILAWCQKTIGQIHQADPPTIHLSEPFSNTYQSLYKELEVVKDRAVGVIRVVHETLDNLSNIIVEYQTAMDIVEESTRRFINESQSSFSWLRNKKKQQIIQKRNRAVCDAYQIAPDSAAVKEAMDQFGITSCGNTAFQYYDPNSELGQIS